MADKNKTKTNHPSQPIRAMRVHLDDDDGADDDDDPDTREFP